MMSTAIKWAIGIILAIIIATVLATANAGEYPKYEVKVADVHDGDSIKLATPIMWPIDDIRIRGVDTPEIGWRAQCPAEAEKAEQARQFVIDHLTGCL